MTIFFFESGSDPDSEQRQRPLRALVADQAHKSYLEDGGSGVELTIAFNANCPIRRKRKDALASELAQLAKRCDNGASGPLPTVIPEILTLYVNTRQHHDAEWHVRGFYTTRSVSADNLERIIKEKEAKAGGYQPCDAYWLLIVVDGLNTAQDQEGQQHDLYISGIFERVLLFRTVFEQVIEVQT